MDKTPPMKLPLRRTPKGPDDHVIINPVMSEWLKAKAAPVGRAEQ